MWNRQRRKVEKTGAGFHRLLTWMVGLVLFALSVSPGQAQSTRVALAPFTGHWKGTFVAYTDAGSGSTLSRPSTATDGRRESRLAPRWTATPTVGW